MCFCSKYRWHYLVLSNHNEKKELNDSSSMMRRLNVLLFLADFPKI